MSKKFGQESIVNPKSGWDDEKEKQYLRQFLPKRLGINGKTNLRISLII